MKRIAVKASEIEPLPRDGLAADQPFTWDDVEARLEGKPWPTWAKKHASRPNEFGT